ncbi:lambda repressor-like predicted transcriptional regulator [Crossiella equi]|uniref:Lambda repressor-like predicted transcriptional regulator n=1 Tax=Crossiella equi TaxID=130796 RepID=A0ABS5ALQ3_9PSEU|nr:helix-turn-helix domain-containing protein [Crossiella equi]MBP2476620.1 lambda repressor-like predicted transcriptional regulator [Crossiella equi]
MAIDAVAQRKSLTDALANAVRQTGITHETLGRATGYSRSHISKVLVGKNVPPRDFWVTADRILDARGTLIDAYDQYEAAKHAPVHQQSSALILPGLDDGTEHELEALELLRRLERCDVGEKTLTGLEKAADALAIAYSHTRPDALLSPARRYLTYIDRLLGERASLAQHRRLLVAGGWVALMGATLAIDLDRSGLAATYLDIADSMAGDAEHPEIRAWARETRAWEMLTNGDYRTALRTSYEAIALAPVGSSAQVQATAQAGRALARLGNKRDTVTVIERVHELSDMLTPHKPLAHHYQYDATKKLAYTATTLAWAGDPAAEGYAREIIRELGPLNGDRWPRRVIAAHLDLARTLVVSGQIDEAATHTHAAISSGIVPSNQWRAQEIVTAVEKRGASVAQDLRDAYEAMRKSH